MAAGVLRQLEAGMSDDVAAFGVYALSPLHERLRRFGQSLGRGALPRRICSLIRRILMAGRSGPFDIEPFPGQRARLYPSENLSDKRVFAAAQFWDWAERAALGRAIRSAAEPVYVVDAGANAGLYTLALRAEARGKALRVLAVEPDPENLSRMRFNIAASGAGAEVTVAPVALSDQAGETHIVAGHANRGELTTGTDGTPVAMATLLQTVEDAGFPRIDALKIDIEGMEEVVLGHYFSNAPETLWPGTVVLEARRNEETPALRHLLALGYAIEERTRMNAVLSRGPAKTDNANV